MAPSTQNFQIIGIWLLHSGLRRKWSRTTRRACVQRATCCSQSRVFAGGALAPNSSYLPSSQCLLLPGPGPGDPPALSEHGRAVLGTEGAAVLCIPLESRPVVPKFQNERPATSSPFRFQDRTYHGSKGNHNFLEDFARRGNFPLSWLENGFNCPAMRFCYSGHLLSHVEMEPGAGVMWAWLVLTGNAARMSP